MSFANCTAAKNHLRLGRENDYLPVCTNGVTTTYNRLSLPQSVTKTSGQSYTYGYLADGTKTSEIGSDGYGYRYLGTMRFRITPTGEVFDSTPFGHGRIVRNQSTGALSAQYHITDHLGSTRYVTNSSGSQTAAYNYTPFGVMQEVGTCSNSTDYTFSGKEKQLYGNVLDFGARLYDPRTAIWNAIDPKAEKYFSISPYAYCNNNPVIFVDPDGRVATDKLIGFLIGIGTNIIPRSSALRDSYSPNNSKDYNSALESADRLSLAVGGSATAAGIGAVLGGEQVAIAGVVVTPTGVGAVVAIGGAGVSISGGIVASVGTFVILNASSNSLQGYNRGKPAEDKSTSNKIDHGKNEKHGDGGRALSKSESRIKELQQQKTGQPRKIREQIERKIKNIREYGEKAAKGEEHSRGNKR